MTTSDRLTNPDDHPSAEPPDAMVTVAAHDLLHALHLLDDLADVLAIAGASETSAGRGGGYADGLASRLRALRGRLSPPDPGICATAPGAGEWRTALCVALDRVRLHGARDPQVTPGSAGGPRRG